MTLKLYFAPGACSFVPHTLLEASGAPFEPVMVKLHKGEQQSPEYRAINPRGQVPVLVDDGQVITQIWPSSATSMTDSRPWDSCPRSRWRARGSWRRWPG